MENGMDPRLALGAAEQQELAARRGMAENLAQGGADDEARRAKMRQACEGFESIFIQKMWEQMRATLPKEGLMKSKEEEFWMSMYDQELARSVTSAGGIGLADMMMRQMSRNEANIGEASRISPSRRPELNVEPAPLLPSSGSGVRSGRDAAAAASVESSPAGAFTRAAERRSSPANPAIPSIYDGEAPAEGVGDAPPERCLHARKLLPRPDAREKFRPQRRPVLPSEIRREERKKRRRFRHPAFQRMIPSVKLLTNSGTRWRHPLPRPRPGRNGPQAAEMSMCLWHPHRIPVLLFSR